MAGGMAFEVGKETSSRPCCSTWETEEGNRGSIVMGQEKRRLTWAKEEADGLGVAPCGKEQGKASGP